MVYANLLHTPPTPLHTPIQNTRNQQLISKCVCSVCKKAIRKIPKLLESATWEFALCRHLRHNFLNRTNAKNTITLNIR